MSGLRALVVTGMSGAGRVTALGALDDHGFEAVDNIPLALIPRLAAAEGGDRPVAIGVDSRTRGFEPSALKSMLAMIGRKPGPEPEIGLLFMECDDEALQRRYTTTRRRHPLAGDRPLLDGINAERKLMRPLRADADWVIDTTGMAPHDLKRQIALRFAADGAAAGPTIAVVSFSFRLGVPREADFVFDARFLTNPHYDERLRPKTGLDPAVQAHIRADPDFESTLARLTALLAPLLPRYHGEGKSYLTFAIGCTGGKHRSVYLSERLAASLRGDRWTVLTTHRDKPQEPDASSKAGGVD